jgi:tetratricopeptide (TPR) repeat protein
MRARKSAQLAMILLGATLTSAAGKPRAESTPRPLASRSFQEILDNYQIIADFEPKDVQEEYEKPLLERTGQIFWRYDFPVDPPKFPVEPLFASTELAANGTRPLEIVRRELPLTQGDGEFFEIVNRGRQLFLQKKFAEAQTLFLKAREMFGTRAKYHRRVDYLIAYATIQLAEEERLKHTPPLDWDMPDVQRFTANVTPFLSSAFILKKDIADPEIEKNSGKAYYNLAAIYYSFSNTPVEILAGNANDPKTAPRPGSWSSMFGTAREGLDWFRNADRGQFGDQFRYRPILSRMIAESLIQNGNFLEAAQAIDTSLRQDQNPLEAMKSFNRLGDMYYDLGNLRLAEDMYALGARMGNLLDYTSAIHLARWGEALFWLGEFDKSQKVFDTALRASGQKRVLHPLTTDQRAILALRISDAWLARAALVSHKSSTKNPRSRDLSFEDLRDQSANTYYSIHHQYPRTNAARLAKIRQACLELPVFEADAVPARGENANVTHARKLLEEARTNWPPKDLTPTSTKPTANATSPAEALRKAREAASANPDPSGEASAKSIPKALLLEKELAWSCEIASYTRRERTPAMVERVREFSRAYPDSPLLRQFHEPVRATQATQIDDLIKAGDEQGVIAFFEANRDRLFTQPASGKTPAKLILSDKIAESLFDAYLNSYKPERAAEFYPTWRKNAQGDLALLKEAVFMAEMGNSREWTQRNDTLARELRIHPWKLTSSDESLLWVQRLLSADGSRLHLSWILRLSRQWANKEPNFDCGLVYPVLARVGLTETGDTGLSGEEWKAEVSRLTDKTLPELFKTDDICARSLLEMEYRAFQGQPETLVRRYLARADWPLTGVLPGLTWAVSEHARRKGMKTDALALWKRLADKAPDDAPEKRFAKSRIDPTKTEFENLWQ